MTKQKTAASLSKAIERDGRSSVALPAGYTTLLTDLKTRVRAAQLRAAISVNRELICFIGTLAKSLSMQQFDLRKTDFNAACEAVRHPTTKRRLAASATAQVTVAEAAMYRT